MSLQRLRKELEDEVARSPLATVPASYVLSMIPEDHELMRWVGTGEASRITGMSQVALRAAAGRWSEMKHPPIRVDKRNPKNPASHWVYNERDCVQFAELEEDG